jgi:hypothetical protein
MIKLLVLSILLRSTLITCPSVFYIGTTLPIQSGTLPSITNTWTLASIGTSVFPSALAVFTWTRSGTVYTIGSSSITSSEHLGGRAFAVGFGDQMATTSGVNGFVGGLSLGVAAGHGPANVVAG